MTATPETATAALSPAQPPPPLGNKAPADRPDSLSLSLIRLSAEVRDAIVAFSSARPPREVSAPNIAGALANEVMVKVVPAVSNLWASCDRYVHVIGTYRDEVNRLIDGADRTPAEAGVRLTAAQFLHQLLAAPAARRLHMLESLAETAAAGRDCQLRDHAGNIADLKQRPTLHAFDMVCASVERQRVALVTVLGLPDDTPFGEAVDAAGVLAGHGGTAGSGES